MGVHISLDVHILKTQEIAFMDDSIKIQTRREFFKKAARGALPILGAIALINAPIVVHAEEKVSMSCKYDCRFGCEGCTGSCYEECQGQCKDGCFRTCLGRCDNDCQGNCKGDCTGNCDKTCQGGCQNSCSGSCSDSCAGSSKQ